MDLSIRVLCRPALARGFQLAGVAVTTAADGPGAVDVLRRLVASPDTGLVLVDDALYRALPRALAARCERRPLPIVASFPPPRWDLAAEAEAHVLEILRQAIGYRVTPR